MDVIHAIDIETTTKELYLEDSPEQFLLRGLDDEGERLNIQIRHLAGLKVGSHLPFLTLCVNSTIEMHSTHF